MMPIYAGDASDAIKRVRYNHCRSNVEASALRQHIATAQGLQLKRTKRPSGSTRVRIDLPDPAAGERQVSDYLCSGHWKYVLCRSYAEAHDFQWFAINSLRPVLNRDRRPWDTTQSARYQDLLAELEASPLLTEQELAGRASGPGVYLLYHDAPPAG